MHSLPLQQSLPSRICGNFAPGLGEYIVPQAQMTVGLTGLPVLCGILKEEKGDKELLRGALECLNVAMSPAQVSLCCSSFTQPHGI